jgi:hypothetical protein
MIRRTFQTILGGAAMLALSPTWAQGKATNSQWQEVFDIDKCKLLTSGRNPYFVLNPGFQLVLEGGGTTLHHTVLDETKTVDGVLTRVIEEREWKDGQLHEVARNYFALCEQTKDVFYFGEEVDFYENGKVVKHDGSWLAGNGNRAGMIMPGTPKLNAKFYQEIAPRIAMDRAEIVSLNETCKTPAGTFTKCMKVKEGTALNVLETEYKYYAPGIGLTVSGDLQLVRYGQVKK